jgi:hypothetical protein
LGQAHKADGSDEAFRIGKRSHQARDSPQGIGELSSPKDKDFGERLHSKKNYWTRSLWRSQSLQKPKNERNRSDQKDEETGNDLQKLDCTCPSRERYSCVG